MSLQYYLRENTLQNGKKYFAQTIHNRNFGDEDLLAYMVKKNTALSHTELRGVLNLYKESLEELLSAGNRIVLSDLLAIYPVVKATFEKSKEGFNHYSNSIKIRCAVSRSLTRKVSQQTEVEKLDNAGKTPKLLDVISGRDEANIIRWPYSTTITGKELNPKEMELQCIRIINQENSDNILEIYAEDLFIDSQSDKELTFSINQSYVIPSWLTPGLAVYLQVEYPAEVQGATPLASNTIKTFWLTIPEDAVTNTEESTDQEPTV